MTVPLQPGKANFGTAPVFLTAISTILGAIMFLRFGYAVGNVGLLGALGIIVVGHLVTIPTAMAIAEIATNQRVEGGGEYFIISRSFGLSTGGAIGIALYFSQAISVAFYIIAFAEAFDPVIEFLRDNYGIIVLDKRVISLPVVVLLAVLMVTKGANLGVKALYVVVAILFASLVFFFLGDAGYQASPQQALLEHIEDPAPLFYVFAICFPAFTGMTAGVGLSGDLRDPKRSIPIGTLSATVIGMFVYVAIAYKLAISAAPTDLATDQLIMSKIALWGPIIPIGLAAATLSSAIGSFLVAPRTLQAIAADGLLPAKRLDTWLARGRGPTHEPFNTTVLTAAFAIVFVLMGDVNFVARIISMFFMVTYGSLCLISFLQHFAADPAYRPTFRSRWFISLFGAVMCVWLMFKMSAGYATLSIAVMIGLYLFISRNNEDRQGLSHIVQGVIFQASRRLQVFLQKSRKAEATSWRPSIACLSKVSFKRLSAFDFMRWIAHRYGFGTYIHYVPGYLSRATHDQARDALRRLIQLSDAASSNVYVDTVVSPSYTTAITQLVQLPGVSGKENNLVLFEYWKTDHDGLDDIIENYPLVAATDFDVCILASCDRGFGYRRQIHIWLTPTDFENAGLMILIAYILLGHPDWNAAVIKIFSILPVDSVEDGRAQLQRLIAAGRLPISWKNVEVIPADGSADRRELINARSRDADLTILGFRGEQVKHQKEAAFWGLDAVGNVLYVNTTKEIDLAGEVQPEAAAPKVPAADATEVPAAQTPGGDGEDSPLKSTV